MKRQRPMDIAEEVKRLAISEQLKDLDEKELNYIYRTIIKIRKEKK